MRRWLHITTGPIFWIAAVQVAWTTALVLWIVFVSGGDRSRVADAGWGVLVLGIVLFALMLLGETVIIIHFARQVAHNRAMKDFVSRVSHALRSPLAIVKLHVETLRLRELPEEQRQACLSAALVELARLEAGIEEVLTASRLERRALTFAGERIELGALLAAYAKEKAAEVATLRGSLELRPYGARELAVRGDPLLLRQLLDNLVGNALVHCPPGVHIRLQLAEQGRCAVLGVADDGPGVPPEERKRVFRLFYRVARPGRHARGTGLGLFIVAGIAQAHGGRAWLEDGEQGRGCLCQVALPLAREEAA